MDLLLFVVGILGFVISIVILIINSIKKRPKKIALIGLVVSVIMVFTGLFMGPVDDLEDVADKPSQEIEEEDTNDEEPEEVEKKEDIKEQEEDTPVPEREFVVGKSNKDFLDITDSKPTDIRNDVTKKWKMVKFAESVDVTEYLISYTDLYWGEDDLVHVLINFNYNTTTVFNDFGSYLSVRVHEYVKKEEHDAKKIGSGLLLAEYNIYKDNGDIVDFDKLVESEENED